MTGIILSVKPQHVHRIIERIKTLEMRKSAPKCEPPFKCYIYMSAGDYAWRKDGWSTAIITPGERVFDGSQMVVAEFVCDRIIDDPTLGHNKVFNALACVTEEEAVKYCNGAKKLCYWHISELKIYEEPKKLTDFEREDTNASQSGSSRKPLKRPPQSWCYVIED